MPEWVRWLCAVFALFRLVQLIVYDDGPGDVIKAFREWIGQWTKLLDCPHCVGIWLAMGCATLALWASLPGDIFLAIWGLAGAQSLLESFSSFLEDDEDWE